MISTYFPLQITYSSTRRNSLNSLTCTVEDVHKLTMLSELSFSMNIHLIYRFRCVANSARKHKYSFLKYELIIINALQDLSQASLAIKNMFIQRQKKWNSTVSQSVMHGYDSDFVASCSCKIFAHSFYVIKHTCNPIRQLIKLFSHNYLCPKCAQRLTWLCCCQQLDSSNDLV